MKITLLVVGKTVRGWIRDGLDIYSGRIVRYVPFEVREIPELKNVSALSREQIKNREGELILKVVKPEDRVILMDERGEQYTSVRMAEILQRDLNSGKNIVYVVGGSYGFSEAVYKRADSLLSLSRMTFSHQMVRVFFAEQLYRAFSIIHGEPYHNE